MDHADGVTSDAPLGIFHKERSREREIFPGSFLIKKKNKISKFLKVFLQYLWIQNSYRLQPQVLT